MARVGKLFESFDYAAAMHEINAFIVTDLSAFYLDSLKDRLYTFAPQSDGRRAAQTTVHRILNALARMTAPVRGPRIRITSAGTAPARTSPMMRPPRKISSAWNS